MAGEDSKSRVLDELNACVVEFKDESLRELAVLMIRGFAAMFEQLEAIRNDEDNIQRIALNGFAGAPHHQHHTFIASELARKDEIDRLRKWAAEKMAEEEADRVQEREAKRAAWKATVTVVTETLVKGVLYVGLMMAGLRFAGPMVLGG